MSKLTLNFEVLLPTAVTKEIEFPFYAYSKKDKIHIMYYYDEEVTFAQFVRLEIKEYNDGIIRMYRYTDSQKELERFLADMEREYQTTTKLDFSEQIKKYIDQLVDLYTFITI